MHLCLDREAGRGGGDEVIDTTGMGPDEKLWTYNCLDCVMTRECGEVETANLEKMGLVEQDAFQQRLFYPVLEAMKLGIRVDEKRREAFANELLAEITAREEWFKFVLGHTLNPRSPTQMQKLFYDDLGQAPIHKRGKGGHPGSLTLDDEALGKIKAREPLLGPLINKIREYRSLGVFLSTFVLAKLDIDGRMRCSFNICGTETFRLSSSENAFGSGTNLQNLPKGGEEDDSDLILPNVRKIFVPDPGYTFFDMDLSKADLRIVAWESDEKELKAMLKEGRDPYIETAREYYKDPTIMKTRTSGETNPTYTRFKSFAHACVTAGHEVLTPFGWVAVQDYDGSSPIMTCSLDGRAWFERPSNWLVTEATEFHSINGQSSDFIFTANHKMPFTVDEADNLRIAAISAIPQSARIPYTTLYEGPSLPPTEEYVRLLAALQADGTIDKYGNVRFHFRKERKISRLRQLLRNYEHTESIGSDGTTTFYVPRNAADFATLGKTAGAYLLGWRAEALDAYMDEHVHWDGWSGGTVQCHISSVDKEHCDWLQTMARLRGKGSQVAVNRGAEGNRQTLYKVTLNSRKFLNLASTERLTYKTESQTVYCPTVSSGLFLLRRNNCLVVSGNSNYMGTPQGLSQRLGLLVHEVDRAQRWYFQRYPAIKKWQLATIEFVKAKHYVANVYGNRRYYFDRIDESVFRQAVAWVGQSTTALTINRIWLNLWEHARHIWVLLQIHDSLAGQFPSHRRSECLAQIQEAGRVVLPYADPLVIPLGISTSEVSWGECK